MSGLKIQNFMSDIRTRMKVPLLDIELILAHLCRRPRSYILAHPEKELTTGQADKARKLIKRRARGEPLAYLFGHKEFYGLDFIVNKHVLVPRPETELMVEEGLEILKNLNSATIVDVGTGSGCIIASLISNLKFLIYISNFQFYATDISRQALSVAKKNAGRHQVDKDIKFCHGNLLEPIINNKNFLLLTSYFLLLANLPYLTPAQIKNSPTIQYEPKRALTAGPDGLKYYRMLFRQIRDLCKTAGICGLSVLAEIDPSQKTSIKKLAKKYLPKASVQIKKDLRGHSRLAVITFDMKHET